MRTNPFANRKSCCIDTSSKGDGLFQPLAQELEILCLSGFRDVFDFKPFLERQNGKHIFMMPLPKMYDKHLFFEKYGEKGKTIF